MRIYCFIFLLFCPICCSAQQVRDTFIRAVNNEEFINRYMRITSTGRLSSYVDTSCYGYYTAMANEDIENGRPLLLVSHSQVQRSYADAEFEERYHVTMQIFSRILLDNQECYEAYNERIFRHLDSTCNKNWRLDASRNANSFIGYKQFAKKRSSK